MPISSITYEISRNIAVLGLSMLYDSPIPFCCHSDSISVYNFLSVNAIAAQLLCHLPHENKPLKFPLNLYCDKNIIDENFWRMPAGLHKIEIGLGTKFQYQFSAWFSRSSYAVW